MNQSTVRALREGTVKASDFALMLLDLASTINAEIDRVHLHLEDDHIEASCEDMRITIALTPAAQEGGDQ